MAKAVLDVFGREHSVFVWREKDARQALCACSRSGRARRPLSQRRGHVGADSGELGKRQNALVTLTCLYRVSQAKKASRASGTSFMTISAARVRRSSWSTESPSKGSKALVWSGGVGTEY